MRKGKIKFKKAVEKHDPGLCLNQAMNNLPLLRDLTIYTHIYK